jgi:acyl carrier protein
MRWEMPITDREEILEKLKLVLGRLMKINNTETLGQWNWNTDVFSDIGLDSVDAIDLAYAIEEEFGVSGNMKDGKPRRKLSDIVDYVVELSSKKLS